MKNILILFISSLFFNLTVYSQDSMQNCLHISNIIDSVMKFKHSYEASKYIIDQKNESNKIISSIIKESSGITDESSSIDFLSKYKKSIEELKNNKKHFYKCFNSILKLKQGIVFVYDYESPLSSVRDPKNRISYEVLLKTIDKFLIKKNEDTLPKLEFLSL